MKRALAFLVLCACAGCRERTPGSMSSVSPSLGPREYRFIDDYRATHYLDLAQRLRNLREADRTQALQRLARDPERGSEVFPLCRLLFKPGGSGEFRRPLLGGASFVTAGSYDAWQLEPITLYRGIPILIVRGYTLFGTAEQPEEYVAYCLSSCEWNLEVPKSPPIEERREILAEFHRMKAHPHIQLEWFLAQAE